MSKLSHAMEWFISIKIIFGSNFGNKNFNIYNGLRIAQMVISPIVKAEIEEVDDLKQTSRGSGGFGSTGLN